MHAPPTIHSTLLATTIAILALGCTAMTSNDSNASGNRPRSVALGQEFAMSPGDLVALPDRSRLHYAGVKSDSRCPPDVRCVWAGDAEVIFEWTPAGGSARSIDLHTGFHDKESKILAAHKLTLVSLERGQRPQARLRLDPAH